MKEGRNIVGIMSARILFGLMSWILTLDHVKNIHPSAKHFTLIYGRKIWNCYS